MHGVPHTSADLADEMRYESNLFQGFHTPFARFDRLMSLLPAEEWAERLKQKIEWESRRKSVLGLTPTTTQTSTSTLARIAKTSENIGSKEQMLDE
jgi:hypothetical protein